MNVTAPVTFHAQPRALHIQCGFGDLCESAAAPAVLNGKGGRPACNRRFVREKTHLFQSGDPLTSLYCILAGSFKTCALTQEGEEMVMGFYLPGEIVGMDAIGDGHHGSRATAIEDSEVCAVSLDHIEARCRRDRNLHRQFNRAITRELAGVQNSMLMLGSMQAEERIAHFLLNLGGRLSALGYSATDMNLRMTRGEIASHLGLRLETVSRCLSRMHESGLLSVNMRHIVLRDLAGLKHLVAQ